MSTLLKAEKIFNRFANGIGNVSAVILLLLLANVFYNVLARYIFNDVSIGMQEMEWHLYSMMFLFGVAYTLKEDGHVRVDLVYERLSPSKRAIIDIGGTLFFLIPFSALIAFYAIDFAHAAYNINEHSGDPGGLPHRWIIKSMISISFICVIISSTGFMLRALNEALGLHEIHKHDTFTL